MYEQLSFVEIEAQHAELLPARTVLSTFGTDNSTITIINNTGDTAAAGGTGGTGGTGTAGFVECTLTCKFGF